MYVTISRSILIVNALQTSTEVLLRIITPTITKFTEIESIFILEGYLTSHSFSFVLPQQLLTEKFWYYMLS